MKRKKTEINRNDMKTYVTKKDDIERSWCLLDASGVRLGRLATKASTLLQGKGKEYYIPNLDCGDYVVIINSDKLSFTPKRLQTKKYYRHSGYPGGFKESTLAQEMKKDSRKVVEKAVKGMLPRTKLGREMGKKLFVYKDEKHKHEAQKPEKVTV